MYIAISQNNIFIDNRAIIYDIIYMALTAMDLVQFTVLLG